MQSFLPDLSARLETTEWMDHPSVGEEHLCRALHDIRRINRLLGGYAASDTVLVPALRAHPSLRVLDVGTGSGDYVAHLIRRGAQHGCCVEAIGVDVNPVIVGVGRAYLDTALSPDLRSRGRVVCDDALELPYRDNAFDICHGALFLHHFHGSDAVALLQEMARVSRMGIVVNDLHRHPLAYAGIWALSRLLHMAPMVQHDGPISVRRGFSKPELFALSRRASLPIPKIHWRWAFRWTLSTLPSNKASAPPSSRSQ